MEISFIDRAIVHLYLLLHPLIPASFIRWKYGIRSSDTKDAAVKKYKFFNLLKYHAGRKKSYDPFLKVGIPFLQSHAIWQHQLKGLLPAKPSVVLSEADKLKTLEEVLYILEQHSIRSFLCFGTLLGLVREHKFLKQDVDIDFGIFYDECDAGRIFDILSENGYILYALEKDPWPCKAQLFHPVTGVLCDIIFFKREPEAFKTYTTFNGHLLVRNRTPFDLTQVSFYHLTVNIPVHPEIFLTENYGNWKDVNQYHHHILSSKLTDHNHPFVKYLFLNTCVESIIRNQIRDAVALVDIWNGKYQDVPVESIATEI